MSGIHCSYAKHALSVLWIRHPPKQHLITSTLRLCVFLFEYLIHWLQKTVGTYRSKTLTLHLWAYPESVLCNQSPSEWLQTEIIICSQVQMLHISFRKKEKRFHFSDVIISLWWYQTTSNYDTPHFLRVVFFSRPSTFFSSSMWVLWGVCMLTR